jgi:hypothetical protein
MQIIFSEIHNETVIVIDTVIKEKTAKEIFKSPNPIYNNGIKIKPLLEKYTRIEIPLRLAGSGLANWLHEIWKAETFRENEQA